MQADGQREGGAQLAAAAAMPAATGADLRCADTRLCLSPGPASSGAFEIL